ncbi:unnamed protein product [Diplocarpon coronariae]
MTSRSRVRALRQAQMNAFQQQQQQQQQPLPPPAQSHLSPSYNADAQPQGPAAYRPPSAESRAVPLYDASATPLPSPADGSPAQPALTGGWTGGYRAPANGWDPMEVDDGAAATDLDQAAWHYQNVAFPAMLIRALVTGTPLEEPPAYAWRRVGVAWEASAFACVVTAQCHLLAQAQVEAPQYRQQ